MKKLLKQLSLLVMVLAVLFTGALALKMGENAVQLPIGTKIEKAGEVTKFLLKDGVLELIGLTGELGVRAYNREGKLLYSGKQARLFAVFSVGKLRNQDTMADDLLFVQFKGLSPQPDPPGKSIIIPRGAKIERGKPGFLRFMLADGRMVEFKSTKSRAGIMGDCGIYSQAGKLLYTRNRGQLCRAVSIQNLRGKVSIDDDVTWVLFGIEPVGR